MIAGTLEIDLVANVARLSKDMQDVNRVVGGAMKDVSRAAEMAKTALEAVGVALSVAALGAFAKSTFDAIAKMKDLGLEAGTTASAMSRFEAPTRLAGLSLEATAAAMFRMSKAALEARDPTSKAAQALASIGISTAQLKGLKPDEMFELVARQLGKYGDGLGKNAVMQELFNKSGKEMNRVVAEIATSGKLAATVTDEEAEAAKKLQDQIETLRINSDKYWRSLVSDAVPALNRVVEEFDRARKAGAGFFTSLLTGMLQGANSTDDLGQQLERINRQIALSRAAADDIAKNGSTFLGIEKTGTLQAAAKLNDLLRQRATIEKLISDQEIAAQDAVAIAGQKGGKAEPDFAARLAAEKERLKITKDLADALEKAARMDEQVNSEATKALADLNKMGSDRVLNLQDQVDKETMELEVMGLSDVERALKLLDYQKELALRGLINDADRQGVEIKYEELKQLAMLKDARAQELQFWGQVSDAAGNFFADLVMNGKSAFDNLRHYVKQLLSDMIALFAKRWVLNMAAGGSVTGSAMDAFAGGAGNGSLASNLIGGVSSWFGGAAAGGSIGAVSSGAFAGGVAGGSAGIGAGATGSFAMGAEGAGMMSGVYEALAAIPVWGWVAMAVIAAVAYFSGKGGGPKVGGSFFQGGAVPGTDNGRFFTPNQGDAQMKTIVDATSGGFLQAFKSLGGTGTPGMNFGLGYDHDPNGSAQSRVSAMLTDAAGKILYNQHDLNMDDKEVPAALQLQAQRMILAALQASDLPKDIADILNSVSAETATSEQIQQAVAAAREMKAVMDALGHLEWGKLDVASLKAMALEGETISQTFQRIAGAMGAFDDAFMTDAQKFERASKHVTDVFASLGIAVPKTTAELVALVHGLDLSTAAGQKMFTMLMSIFPDLQLVFNSVGDTTNSFTGAVDHATSSVNDFSASLGNPRRDLGDWLNKLTQDPNLSTLSLQERYDQTRKELDTAFRLHDAGGIQTTGQQYLELAKQLFGQGSPAYTAIFQSFYEQASKVGVGARPFQEAFNAALPKVGTMASSADLNVQTRVLGGLLQDVRDVVTEAKNEIKGLRKDVKESTVKPFGA